MERKKLDVLYLNDDDLECDKGKKYTLDDINMSKVGFKPMDIEKYKIIIYKGKLGRKVLRFS